MRLEMESDYWSDYHHELWHSEAESMKQEALSALREQAEEEAKWLQEEAERLVKFGPVCVEDSKITCQTDAIPF